MDGCECKLHTEYTSSNFFYIMANNPLLLKKKVVFPLFDFFPLQRSTAFEMVILERIKQICGLVQNVSLLFETFPLLILML